MNADEMIAEYRRLAGIISEFEDHAEGPWLTDDGRPWVNGGHDTGMPVRPPAHHPRRCHGVSKHGKDHRCPLWARVGRTLCKFHGGQAPGGEYRGKLPMRYKKNLAPNLAKRLEEFLGSETHQEQLQLYEEIALARVMLAEQLTLASACAESDKVTTETKLLSMQCAAGMLDRVAELCAKMGRIEKDLGDQVSIRQLGAFVRQITHIIYQKLGDVPLADEIAEALIARVQLPEDPRTDAVVKLEFEA